MKKNYAMEHCKGIKEKLKELLESYYNGSFAQLVCEYIRITGMTQQEVENLLEDVKRSQGSHAG